MGMRKPDRFQVQLVDYGNEVSLEFDAGAGAARLRWGARLTPEMAAEIAQALAVAWDAIERSKKATKITIPPGLLPK